MELKFVNKSEIREMPKVLYKYRTWNKEEHKRLLTHCEIYYASPDEFNEVTECNLERDYDSITEDMIWEFCRNEALRQVIANEIPVSVIENKVKELYETNLFHDKGNRQRTKKFMKTHLNKTLSIFSATLSSTNERLWNTFASNKQGYCVGIDFTEMYKNAETFGSCSHVHYYDEKSPPKIPAFSLNQDEQVMNMLKVIYSLPNKFEDEQEFRLSKVNIENRKIILNSDWISEVIIGSEVSKADEEEIIEIVKKNYPNAKLKKLFFEPTFKFYSVIDY